jgi:hypothetical protein
VWESAVKGRRCWKTKERGSIQDGIRCNCLDSYRQKHVWAAARQEDPILYGRRETL